MSERKATTADRVTDDQSILLVASDGLQPDFPITTEELSALERLLGEELQALLSQ